MTKIRNAYHLFNLCHCVLLKLPHHKSHRGQLLQPAWSKLNSWLQREKKRCIFFSHLLWACRQGMPQLPSNATQQGQRAQEPKSTHSSNILQSWKISVDPQMCNMFYCKSAFTAFICFNCHEIGLVAVVLRHHNMLTPASPPFNSFSEILPLFSTSPFLHDYCSLRLLFLPLF